MVTLNVELAAKRLQLLHELVPAANNIALLVNPTDSNVETTLKSLRAAARDLGVQLHVLRASTEREIDDAFAALSQLKAGGVVIGPDVFFNTRSEQLGALASRHGVAAIYQYRAFALAGGLMSYSGDIRNRTVWPVATPARFSRARSRPICRSSRPPKSS